MPPVHALRQRRANGKTLARCSGKPLGDPPW